MIEELNFDGEEKLNIKKKEELICPVRYFLEVAGGKWKSSILCILSDCECHRYSRIKRKLNGITNTMLAKSLKELEADGMLERIQYNEVPPRVEYKLTEKGEGIMPILEDMAKWGFKNVGEDAFCGKCNSIK
ncbi:MAG: hypothetical protein PEPC_00926 [Peptostreptococcus russellii]|uniref:winged helix-turn-helix transcriptional regulator n=1 Tax=Peptostreptococcus russellii TaxID=215200 RepID=UPI000D0FB87A|nr:helix-turn-helix domain-containing protein [Peptostreptococcus russellii]